MNSMTTYLECKFPQHNWMKPFLAFLAAAAILTSCEGSPGAGGWN